jgi:hypothetical protein
MSNLPSKTMVHSKMFALKHILKHAWESNLRTWCNQFHTWSSVLSNIINWKQTTFSLLRIKTYSMVLDLTKPLFKNCNCWLKLKLKRHFPYARKFVFLQKCHELNYFFFEKIFCIIYSNNFPRKSLNCFQRKQKINFCLKIKCSC